MAWCKSGTRTPRPQDPGTWDLGPPESLKLGPEISLKIRSRTPGPTSKFKSGTPEPPCKA